MLYIVFHIDDLENPIFYKSWSEPYEWLIWPSFLKMCIFNIIYTKIHVYHLKYLKKLYKRHLIGTYRFLIRNNKIRPSMYYNCDQITYLNPKHCAWKHILKHEFFYFWSEIDTFRLNVFYITFWDLSNGIYSISYRWCWKSNFSQVMVRTLWMIALTIIPENVHFQYHLYENSCIPFEISQKVI